MQNITDLQKTLQPVFERHYTEKVYLTNAHNNSMNFYVVGCTRVGLTALKNDISSVEQDSTVLDNIRYLLELTQKLSPE